MDPNVVVGVALLSWVVVQNRSDSSRVLLALALFAFGWEPASRGSSLGVLLLAVAAGSAMSVAWDPLLGLTDRVSAWLRRNRRPWT